MTIYNFNLGIGWASSGVEYAQAYRASILRKINKDAKFIFTDMYQDENIQHMTNNIGFKDSEVIWLYQYFTDIKIAPTVYTLEMFENTFEYEASRVEKDGNKIVRYFFDEQELFYTVFLAKENSNLVARVEYVSRGFLIRKDFFSYTRVFTEYYTPRDNRAYLYQRRFYNEDGTTAYDELIDGEDSIFRFPNKILYSKEQLVEYFVTKLELTEKDIVIIDRSTSIGQPILKNAKPAKVGIVVHAEHFSENATDDNYILWNNYYDYQFSNADKFDFFIVSTDAQKNLLDEQFKKYTKFKNVKIVTIPVGSIDELKYNDERKHYGLVTASRLAGEKHIDWLVKSVVKAQKNLPQLTFDIYGDGGERGKLEQLIKDNDAENFIKLLGHKKLEDVYKEYEIYIAASTSEGFGLTLLEAIGSGLPLIGLDVRYGNQTFVDDEKNGYLIKNVDMKQPSEFIDEFAEFIEKIYKDNNISAMREHSYTVASKFLTSEIEKKWKTFVEEIVND